MALPRRLRAGKSWCDEQIAGFQEVRDLVVSELNALGDRCEVPSPNGAFYVLAKVATQKTDMQLVEQLIRQYGIAVMPGSTFGVTKEGVPQGCSIRMAYGALNRESVAEGMGRLAKGLRELL